MRALCGAIITAGALIGLGLASIGFGMRYANVTALHGTGTGSAAVETPLQMHLWQSDTPFSFVFVFLTIVACIGLATAFVGLAYHHHRRHHELLHRHGVGAMGDSSIPRA